MALSLRSIARMSGWTQKHTPTQIDREREYALTWPDIDIKLMAKFRYIMQILFQINITIAEWVSWAHEPCIVCVYHDIMTKVLHWTYVYYVYLLIDKQTEIPYCESAAAALWCACYRSFCGDYWSYRTQQGFRNNKARHRAQQPFKNIMNMHTHRMQIHFAFDGGGFIQK